MPFVRSVLIIVIVVMFFLVGASVQMLLARRPALSRQILKAFCRVLLWLLRVRTEVSGGLPLDPAVLLAANHISWIDILVIADLTPCCFLAKQEIASWPLISSLARAQGTVFIDRSRPRGIPPANREMAARLEEGQAVLLFPEGTTHDGKTPGKFHSSHFAAARDYLARLPGENAVSVQPVALAYSADFAAWIGDDALLPHIWRVLCREPLTCRVVYTAPIIYHRTSDRKEIARAVRAAIEAALQADDRQAAPYGLVPVA